MSAHGSPPIQRPAALAVASSSVAQVRTRIAGCLSRAARPQLKTDEPTPLDGLGLGIGRNLTISNVTKAELEGAEAGITDGTLKATPKADLDTWGPKIQGRAAARAAVTAEAEKKASQA